MMTCGLVIVLPGSGDRIKMPEDHECKRAAAEQEEPPPFFGTWNRLYGSIIAFTFALVLLLYLMTVTLNR